MDSLPHQINDGILTVSLIERVDATNAQDVEDAVLGIMNAGSWERVVLDASQLSYLSSAGIRMLLRVAKTAGNFSMQNVSSEVYEVLDMTGITEMLEIVKAYRQVSVDGCPVIGEGANGVVYRIDPETICKVYRNSDALPEIKRERELSRAAFVAGIPTAIPYDVVRVGESFGSVFELLDADSMADLVRSGAWPLERVASESARLMRQMATTEVVSPIIPAARDEALTWVDDIAPVLDDTQLTQLRGLIESIPDDPYMVHGDFHFMNVMVQNEEPLLIDLDTLSHGNGVFDLAATYNTYVGRALTNPKNVEAFLGIPTESSNKLWDLIFEDYFEDASDEEKGQALDKIRLLSSVRLLGWPLRHQGIDEELYNTMVDTYRGTIEEILPRIQSLAI